MHQRNRVHKLNELIEKIKIQINAILDIKVGDTTVKGSLSQIDSRASAIPIAAIITVFLFLVIILKSLFHYKEIDRSIIFIFFNTFNNFQGYLMTEPFC